MTIYPTHIWPAGFVIMGFIGMDNARIWVKSLKQDPLNRDIYGIIGEIPCFSHCIFLK